MKMSNNIIIININIIIKNDLAEKNDKEIIKVNNYNYKNNIKEPMLNINKINQNEIDRKYK